MCSSAPKARAGKEKEPGSNTQPLVNDPRIIATKGGRVGRENAATNVFVRPDPCVLRPAHTNVGYSTPLLDTVGPPGYERIAKRGRRMNRRCYICTEHPGPLAQ